MKNRVTFTALWLFSGIITWLIPFCLSAVKLQPGDIIFYNGAFSNYVPNTFIQHAGIYIGDPKHEVIEFNGGANNTTRDSTPRIVSTSLKEFRKSSPDKKIYRLNIEQEFPGKQVLAPESVVTCAKEFLKNNGEDFGTYDPVTRNCQHFVTHCKLGEAISWQTDFLTKKLHDVLSEKNASSLLKGAMILSKTVTRLTHQ